MTSRQSGIPRGNVTRAIYLGTKDSYNVSSCAWISPANMHHIVERNVNGNIITAKYAKNT